MNQDSYFKQMISFTFRKTEYVFNVSQELFSSHSVDIGTQRLLRTFLNTQITPYKKILDLGCGYGPLGIVLKKENPKAEVHFVDRDALALEYALQNADLNHVQKSSHFTAGLGYDSVRGDDFDLIISNIPAKVGDRVLEHFLFDARFHLSKEGRVAIVVVDAIDPIVKRLLTRNEGVRILYQKSWPGHHVYHYSFLTTDKVKARLAYDDNAYSRTQKTFKSGKGIFQIKTTYHLREFDELGFDTQLVLANLEKLHLSLQGIAVVYPGQGYIPVAVVKQFPVEKLLLIDRDLQALRISEENVIQNGYPKNRVTLLHQTGWGTGEAQVSAVVGIIPEKQNKEVYERFLQQAAINLEENGRMLVASTSTTIFRLEEINKNHRLFNVVSREKNKGMSAILLSKKK